MYSHVTTFSFEKDISSHLQFLFACLYFSTMLILLVRKCEYGVLEITCDIKVLSSHSSLTRDLRLFLSLVISKTPYSHFLLTVFSHYEILAYNVVKGYCLIKSMHFFQGSSARLIILAIGKQRVWQKIQNLCVRFVILNVLYRDPFMLQCVPRDPGMN